MSSSSSTQEKRGTSYARDNRLMRDGGRLPEAQLNRHKRSSSLGGNTNSTATAASSNCNNPSSHRRSSSGIPPSSSLSNLPSDILPSAYVSHFNQEHANGINYSSLARLPFHWTPYGSSNAATAASNATAAHDASAPTAPPLPAAASRRSDVVELLDTDDDGEDDGDDGDEGEGMSRRLVLKVKQALNKNSVQGNNDTYSHSFYKESILNHLMKHRVTLLDNTAKFDKEEMDNIGDSLRDRLNMAIPSSVKKSISKAGCVDIFVDAWRVLGDVICHRKFKLPKKVERDLDAYIALMENVVNSCQAELDYDDDSDVNGASAKLPKKIAAAEVSRGYMGEGATMPPARFGGGICPACGFKSMHEPPENKQRASNNKKKRDEWKEVNRQVQEAKVDEDAEFPVYNGKTVSVQLPKPKQEDEFLICKQVHFTHSRADGGYKCDNCIDRTCNRCRNKCKFITTKK